VEWLEARGDQWKAQVQVVVIDMCSPYRSAVQQALPEARLVADRFHLVRLANEMVTDVRQRVFREQRHRRGRAVDPAWANRRLLLRAGDQLSDRALSRLTATFAADDPTGEIGAAWGVKERLRMLLATSDRHSSAEALRFHQTVLAAELPEATRLAHTLDAWWPRSSASSSPGTPTPAPKPTNRMIKDAGQIAFGFRNLDHQRRRVRFHCTRRSRRDASAQGFIPPQL